MGSRTLNLDDVITRLKSMQGGKTQLEFAEELGVTQQALSKIYAGQNPGPRVLKRLRLRRVVVFEEVSK